MYVKAKWSRKSRKKCISFKEDTVRLSSAWYDCTTGDDPPYTPLPRVPIWWAFEFGMTLASVNDNWNCDCSGKTGIKWIPKYCSLKESYIKRENPPPVPFGPANMSYEPTCDQTQTSVIRTYQSHYHQYHYHHTRGPPKPPTATHPQLHVATTFLFEKQQSCLPHTSFPGEHKCIFWGVRPVVISRLQTDRVQSESPVIHFTASNISCDEQNSSTNNITLLHNTV